MQMHIFHSNIQSMICTVTFPNQLRAKNANEYATESEALEYSARLHRTVNKHVNETKQMDVICFR